MWFSKPGAVCQPKQPTTPAKTPTSGVIRQIEEKQFTD